MEPLTKLGAITIGQKPRADLVEPVRRRLPGVAIREEGLLDGLNRAALPRPIDGGYPLLTTLADGNQIAIDEHVLLGPLQRVINTLQNSGVSAMLLLCTAPFAGVRSSVPLYRPFLMTLSFLKVLYVKRIGVLSHYSPQNDALARKWRAEGIECIIRTADFEGNESPLKTVASLSSVVPRLSHIVVDYFGLDRQLLSLLQAESTSSIIDPMELCLTNMEALFWATKGEEA